MRPLRMLSRASSGLFGKSREDSRLSKRGRSRHVLREGRGDGDGGALDGRRSAVRAEEVTWRSGGARASRGTTRTKQVLTAFGMTRRCALAYRLESGFRADKQQIPRCARADTRGSFATNGKMLAPAYLNSVLNPGRLHCICRLFGIQWNSAIMTLPISSSLFFCLISPATRLLSFSMSLR